MVTLHSELLDLVVATLGVFLQSECLIPLWRHSSLIMFQLLLWIRIKRLWPSAPYTVGSVELPTIETWWFLAIDLKTGCRCFAFLRDGSAALQEHQLFNTLAYHEGESTHWDLKLWIRRFFVGTRSDFVNDLCSFSWLEQHQNTISAGSAQSAQTLIGGLVKQWRCSTWS